jgi:hypothetical protein
MTADFRPPPSWLADALVVDPALGDALRADCDVARLRVAAARVRFAALLLLPAVRPLPCEPLWDPAVERRREDVLWLLSAITPLLSGELRSDYPKCCIRHFPRTTSTHRW